MKQLPILKIPRSTEFGGELLLNKRKTKRPLAYKSPLHIVLRADISRSGSMVLKERTLISSIDKTAQKMRVFVYKKAINSNHIHLVIRVGSRESYNSFIRILCGLLAIKFKIFWILRPFTRILTWGRDFMNVCRYVLKNELEAKGLILYTPRRRRKVKKLILDTT